MRFSLRYMSWISLVLALILSAAVGYFAWTIAAEEEQYALRALEMQESSVKQASALRLHMLARDTQADREALEGLLSNDVDEILDGIEEISRIAGVSLEIGQAFPSEPEKAKPRTINVVVTGGASFVKLLHATALIESFPIPSAIDEVQLERSESADASWRLVVRMRVFTSHDIAS